MRVFFILLFILNSYLSNAQYKITHYDALNGLPHDLCYGIIQDSNGYIWLGTDDGLVKFNGKTFKDFKISDGLLSNYIIDVCEVNDSTFAIATWGGGMQIVQNDKIIPYPSQLKLKSKINKLGKLSDYIFAKGVGKKYHFYSKTSKGDFKEEIVTYFFDKKLLVSRDLQIKNFVIPQFEIIDNQIFFFNEAFFSNNQFKGIFTSSSPSNLKPVFPFLKDQIINDFGKYSNTIYYAFTNDEIYLFSKEKIIKKMTIPFRKETIKKGVLKGDLAVFVLKENNEKTERVVVWNYKKNTFFYLSATELDGKQVSDILIDDRHSIWISVYGTGLFKLALENGYEIKNELKKQNIYDVAKTKTSLMFLTSNKIISLNVNSLKKDSLMFDESLWRINGFLNDTLLIKTRNPFFGNYSRELRGIPIKISKLEHLVVKNNNLEIRYGDNQIVVYKNNKKQVFLIDGLIRKAVKKEKLIYLCTNVGLLVFDLSTMSFSHKFSIENGLQNEDIRDVIISDSKIYLATINGLSVIEKNNIENYTKNFGLLSSNINCLLLDHNDVLWLGTQKGFSLFKDKRFYTFYKNDGKNSSFIQKIIEDNNHHIWLVGNNGAMKVDNSKIFEPTQEPVLDIVKSKNKFTVNVISFENYEIITQYKINNNVWETLQSDFLDFSNFKYGNYKVEFRTRNINSNWNYSKQFNVTNEAPWYQQWWSLLLFIVLIALLSSSVIYLRYKHVSKRNEFLKETIKKNEVLQNELNEVRENVAQDFHDELGNKLAGITVLSGMMIEDEEFKASNWYNQLSRINKDAQDLYFGIKDFIWSIDSKNDDLNELFYYLKDFGEELFSTSNIQFNMNNSIEEEIKLPYYWSRQLLLLFKEAMTNTLKYSEATDCLLQFKVKKGQLSIVFSDNGRGFDINNLKRKNGLINMEKRALKIQGQLEIDSSKGTKVKFSSHIL